MGRAMAGRGTDCNGIGVDICHDNKSTVSMVRWRKSMMHYREWYYYVVWRIEKALRRIRQFVA